MSYAHVDENELLHIALEAMNTLPGAQATDVLKELIRRNPGHPQAHFLLAAQHAQIGLMDRAEEGFRTAVSLAGSDFPMPRFQLGQLLLIKGERAEATEVLAPLAGQGTEVGAYARALTALAREDRDGAIFALREGLVLPQSIPPLAEDMQRLLAELERGPSEPAAAGDNSAASMLLSNYGRH